MIAGEAPARRGVSSFPALNQPCDLPGDENADHETPPRAPLFLHRKKFRGQNTEGKRREIRKPMGVTDVRSC